MASSTVASSKIVRVLSPGLAEQDLGAVRVVVCNLPGYQVAILKL